MSRRNRAVEDVLAALRKGKGERDVWFETRCVLGTHRSVAVAEVVGEVLRGKGVAVGVQHPHVRGARR
jgi:RNase adaptor protein for sRNA GlmZ degradation